MWSGHDELMYLDKKEITLKANNLLKNKNYHTIKDYDKILCQINYFDHFMNYILPIIKKNNKKIILITTQWYLPQIEKSDLSLKDYSNYLGAHGGFLDHFDSILFNINSFYIYTLAFNLFKY